MPSVQLSDKQKLNIDVKAELGSPLLDLVRGGGGFRFPSLNFRELQATTLAEVPLKQVSAGAGFEQTAAAVVNTGISVELSVARKAGGSAVENLFDSDIPIGDAEAWIGVRFGGSLGSGITRAPGDLKFGLATTAGAGLAYYRRFSDATPFLDALGTTFQSITLPDSLESLRKLTEGAIAIAEGVGTLKVSGAAKVTMVPNPLASVDLPLGAGSLNLKAAGSVSVGAVFSISGGYQVRARKLDRSRVELGFYRHQGSEWGVSVEAQAGLQGGVGQFDLIRQVMGAVSRSAKADVEALEQAGLRDDQIAAMSDVVKEGIQRNLAASLNMAITSGEANSRAFLYIIDLNQLSDAGPVEAALKGDLSRLDGAAGVTLVHTILTEREKHSTTLRLNLLGIYNYISVGKLTLNGLVKLQPNGDILITDTATAERYGISMVHIGDDAKKIRKMLAESFLISAAYRCSQLAPAPPELAVTHTYFEADADTDGSEFKDNLDVIQALDLLSASTKRQLVEAFTENVRTTLYVGVDYDNALATSLFLDDEEPRSLVWYENAGRWAVLRLCEISDKLGYLRCLAADEVWATLQRTSIAGFGEALLRDHAIRLADTQVAMVRLYYLVISWWAKAMRAMAESLKEIHAFVKAHPTANPTGPEFTRLRENLQQRLRNVAKHSKEEFGEPWGVVATYLALDASLRSRAQATAKLTVGDRLLHYERPAAISAHGE